MAINVNGTDRLSYTFDTIDDETGDLVATNESGTFFVMDAEVAAHVEAVRDYIREHKLAG